MLERIRTPEDLRPLSEAELLQLATEIRETIIRTVSVQGGHLASNLGVVELTLALHLALHCPQDKLIFDVGHQSYVHKLLTGRQEGFAQLRSDLGVAGFPRRTESPYDCFETGHSSTAISAALGFVRARDLAGERHKVVAVVGDGAMTGGLCYEALNDAGGTPSQLLVVLNDNEMSISRNVGGLAAHLTRLRASRSWQGAKQAVKRGVERIPFAGRALSHGLDYVKTKLRRMMVPGAFFEAFGFRYLGPIDGHDLGSLTQILQSALEASVPTVLHVITQKGHGYTPAENHPEKYHGVAPFFIEGGPDGAELQSCSQTVGDTLVQMADEDARVAAITAAMPTGTGLDRFQKAHAKRFFDVGIAEQHAATLAAGMAAGGMRPYFAVYSSFLQRAYDQVLHDGCHQSLPVTLLIDRSGFVAGDGSTHQGLYDIGFLRAIPNLTLWAPSDLKELEHMLRASLSLQGPCAIRYPKALPECLAPSDQGRPGAWSVLREGDQIALLAFGALLPVALACAEQLGQAGLSAAVVRASGLKPLDARMLEQLHGKGLALVTLEEQQLAGGFGSSVLEHCQRHGHRPPLRAFGVDDRFVGLHSVQALREASGMDAPQMARTIARAWEEAAWPSNGSTL